MTTIPRPTALYLFDRTGQDTMGTNDLTAFGTPTYTTGIIDYAAVLNGSSQYFQAASSTALDITTQDFSIWGYLYRTTDSGAQEDILLKENGTNGYSVFISNTDKLSAFILQGGVAVTVASTSSIIINTWYFWAVSYSRAGNLTLYLYNMSVGTNESSSSSIASLSASISNANKFTVGRDTTSAAFFFPGYVDHVNFLSGTAITAQNVSDIYNTTRVSIHKRNSTDNTSITYFEARNFNGVAIRGQSPSLAITDIVNTEKDTILTTLEGPTMQITVDWIITDEDTSVVFDDVNGSVTSGISAYKYLYDTLWPTGSGRITAEHTLTLYNANDKSFVRTGVITGIDVMQSSDQPLTFRCTLQFTVGKVN